VFSLVILFDAIKITVTNTSPSTRSLYVCALHYLSDFFSAKDLCEKVINDISVNTHNLLPFIKSGRPKKTDVSGTLATVN
jgi:hypothetical protein